MIQLDIIVRPILQNEIRLVCMLPNNRFVLADSCLGTQTILVASSHEFPDLSLLG